VTFEQLILQQRPHITQVVRDLARRHHLAPAEIEEFAATAMQSLERNEFELLRAFDGRSTWETYLTLVVTREFFLFQAELWGQWRPTAAARRLGPAAILLEELVIHDHLPVSEAIELMRTVHRVDLPRYRISEMAVQLRLDQGAAVLGGPPAALRNEAHSHAHLQQAVKDALTRLSPDDRLIVELRFRDGQPLKRIARMMRIEMRPLQRRLEHVQSAMATSLLADGISPEHVNALLQNGDSDVSQATQTWWQTALSGPSK
jgi:DNA-directed RNA polymerase specialized sigma24 family protein